MLSKKIKSIQIANQQRQQGQRTTGTTKTPAGTQAAQTEETPEEILKRQVEIYKDVISEEKSWADYLFKYGPVIGLNSNILKDFVDYTAVGALKEVGIKYQAPAPKNTPIPWFNKHVNTSNKQTALQENESTNYVIGVMSDALDYEALPDL